MKNSKFVHLIFLLSLLVCIGLNSFTVGAYALTDSYDLNINQIASLKAGSYSVDLRFEDTLSPYGGSLPCNSIIISVPKWYNSNGFIQQGFYSEIIPQEYYIADGNGHNTKIADYTWRGYPCWDTLNCWSFTIYVQDRIVEGCKVKFLTVDAIFTPNGTYSQYISTPRYVQFYFGDKDKGYSSSQSYNVLGNNSETSIPNYIYKYMQNWYTTIDGNVTRYTHFIGPISLYQGAHFDGSLSDGSSSDDNIFNIDMSGAGCTCSGGSSNCECGYYWDKLQDIFGEDLSGLSIMNENISNMSNQINNIQNNLNQVYNVIVGSPAPSEPSTDENGNPISTTSPIDSINGFTGADYSFEDPSSLLEDVQPVLSDLFGSFPPIIIAGISLIAVVLLAVKIISR